MSYPINLSYNGFQIQRDVEHQVLFEIPDSQIKYLLHTLLSYCIKRKEKHHYSPKYWNAQTKGNNTCDETVVIQVWNNAM